VFGIGFSPSSRLLASASSDRTIRLWDVATRKQLGQPLQGLGIVYRVAFSPDGKLLASTSEDKTVRLWDVSTHRPFQPLQGHSDTVIGVAFSPDGKLLASASHDHTVMLWDLDPQVWISRTCSIVNRNLSADEWKQYVGPGTPYRKTCPLLPAGEGTEIPGDKPSK
jgi:WD40 repeat protein